MGLRTFLARMGVVSSNVEVYIDALLCKRQGAPATMTGAATLTAAQLLTGIVVATPVAAVDYTLPTGEDLDDALTLFMGDDASFDFSIINLSATDDDIITLLVNTGVTIVGSPYVNANEFEQSYYRNTGVFRCRKTADDTFIVYRIG